MKPTNNKIVLLGYSGHGIVVADCALVSGMDVQFYAERRAVAQDPFMLTYLGFEGDKAFTGWNNHYGFILGVGENKIRLNVAEKVEALNEQILQVIHPTASVSESVSLGRGIFIAKHASVNPLAQLGNFAILNTGSIVEHECVIGEAAHIAPGAVLAGSVRVGALSFIGANAVVKQGVQIGNNVTVGAGAVVIRDIADNETWAGNPAKRIR